MRIGQLDRLVQFERAVLSDDGLRSKEVFGPHGDKVWAFRRDVSDGERAVAGWVEATVVSRFVVYSTAFTRGLTPKDRLICGGLTYDILGIKEVGRMAYLEITGKARTDVG